MSGYEYREFRAMDRLLTQAQQKKVKRLSSRAVVSDRHAVFIHNYSSFRGNEDALLTSPFDALFSISSYGGIGGIQLAFGLPMDAFDLARARPYLVEEDSDADGVTARVLDNRLIVTIRLSELAFGWAEGEGYLAPMLPLREHLLKGDLRPLYLGWLAAFSNFDFDEEDEEDEATLLEAPVPPGMNELQDVHRAFVQTFDIPEGLLNAAVLPSLPLSIPPEDDGTLNTFIASLPLQECHALLRRVAQGDGVEVARGLLKDARKAHPRSEPVPPDRRTLSALRADSERAESALERQRREAYLRDLESREEALWTQVETLLTKPYRRFQKPIALLEQLMDLAVARGRKKAFDTRLAPLVALNHRSKSFMSKAREAGLLS